LTDEATIEIGSEGTYLGASPNALAILGVTLDELLVLPPGALASKPADPIEQQSFRDAWEAAGTPPIGGEATIKRPDGTSARVSFAIFPKPDGTYLATIEPVESPEAAPPIVYTIGRELTRWRAAQLELERVPEGGTDWTRLTAEIAEYRKRFPEFLETE
jgi:PAS domain-containing protein